tara:strand:+ start:4126 stop:4473 length:348 start_codon:yes stop_codon:yes gene_type:complete
MNLNIEVVAKEIIARIKDHNLHGLTRHCVCCRMFADKVMTTIGQNNPIDASSVITEFTRLEWATEKWIKMLDEKGMESIGTDVNELLIELDVLRQLLMHNQSLMVFPNYLSCDNN